MALGTMNANARRLFNDTAGAQSQKGTETAHGTKHRPATKQYAVQFNSRRGEIKFNAKSKKRMIKQTKPTRNLHNTNAQFPLASLLKGKRRRSKVSKRSR